LACGTTKHTDNCDRKLSPHPTIFHPKIYLLLTKTAPPFLTMPLIIYPAFLLFIAFCAPFTNSTYNGFWLHNIQKSQVTILWMRV